MWSYNQTVSSDELYHYGVPGIKWGRRKARYEAKASEARKSARKLQEGARNSSGRKSDRKAYKAQNERIKANTYSQKAKEAGRKEKFVNERAQVKKSRSHGAKIATNIFAGPFANRMYDSVIAGGGTKTGARVVTALASGMGVLTGGLSNLAISGLYTRAAAKQKTVKRYK